MHSAAAVCQPNPQTKHLLCIHKNLDIDKVIEMKVCEATTVGCLYASHGEGEGPRLTHERLCEVCVRNKARTISLEAKMTRDQGFLHHCESPCDGTGLAANTPVHCLKTVLRILGGQA